MSNQNTNIKDNILIINEDSSILASYEKYFPSKTYGFITVDNIESLLNSARHHKLSAVIFYEISNYQKEISSIKERLISTKNFPIPILSILKTDQHPDNSIEDLVYCVPRSIEIRDLEIVMRGLLHQNKFVKRTMENTMRMFLTNKTMLEGKFKIRDIEEAKMLSIFIGNLFNDTKSASLGVFELILNAIEHGNLQIGYDLKSKLVLENKWKDEVMKRLRDKRYEKHVVVLYKRTDDGIYVKVIDEGLGFDWKKYLLLDLSSYAKPTGRGIAFSKAQCFDVLAYNDKGNEVTAFCKNESTIKW